MAPSTAIVYTSDKAPWGLKWRSSTFFILATVAAGLFTDLFIYGLIVPIVPFILRERMGVDGSKLQIYISLLLAIFSGACIIFSPIAGWIADQASSRKGTYSLGLICLFASTLLTAIADSMWLLFIARILGGMSGAVVWCVGLALVIDTVGSDKLGVAFGTMFSFIGVGELISPVLGGIVYGKAGSWATFSMAFALIAIETVMRLLIIEKKVALTYGVYGEEHNSRECVEDLDEMTSLLQKSDDDLEKWRIPDDQPKLIQTFPFLYCFTDSRLLAAWSVMLMHSTIYGVFDATLPAEAIRLFNVDSLQAGVIFIPLFLPALVLGPLGGRLVDWYGTKPLAVIGLALIVAPMVALRIPHEGGVQDMLKLCIILSFGSVCLALFGSVPIVEVSKVVGKYHEANREFFGEQGPYGQSYAVGSMVFSCGLTIGPALAGGLREKIGFGNMNAVVAALCAVTSVVSYKYVGVKPDWMKRRRR